MQNKSGGLLPRPPSPKWLRFNSLESFREFSKKCGMTYSERDKGIADVISDWDFKEYSSRKPHLRKLPLKDRVKRYIRCIALQIAEWTV